MDAPKEEVTDASTTPSNPREEVPDPEEDGLDDLDGAQKSMTPVPLLK